MSETKINAAILKAQRAIQPVAKGSKNDHHGYHYASAEDVLAAAREVLNEAGLALICTGTGMEAGRLTKAYLLLHESGESMPLTSSLAVCPGKGRPEDKAELASATECLGYILRDLLLIPRVDAEDVSGRKDDPAPKSTPRPAPKQEEREPGPVEVVPADSVDCPLFVVTHIAEKPTKTGGVRYGFQLQPQAGGEKFYVNSFSDTYAEAARHGKDNGLLVACTWDEGKYGLDVTDLVCTDSSDSPF